MAIEIKDQNREEKVVRFADITIGDWFAVHGVLWIKDTGGSARSLPLFLRATYAPQDKVALVDVKIGWRYVEGGASNGRP